MERFELLRNEIKNIPDVGTMRVSPMLFYEGIKEHYTEEKMTAKARAWAYMLEAHEKYVYENDMILGSYRGIFVNDLPPKQLERANRVYWAYGGDGDCHHFAPDYEYILNRGIKGVVEEIRKARLCHALDEDKCLFLDACEISIKGLGGMLRSYGQKALEMGKLTESDICMKLAWEAPGNYREALQLMWMCHISFHTEGRPAMALGRVDQFLYPFYDADIKAGRMSREEAVEFFASAIYKMMEFQMIRKKQFGKFNYQDVMNIVIGGIDKEGNCAENELSYVIIDAVKLAGISGPNLSARISSKTSERFWDECLKCIGTGIGYPALMNDEVIIPALMRRNISLEDCRNYAMVGCIENFIPGKQPCWTDTGINVPKLLEYTINSGMCMLSGEQMGLKTTAAEEIDSMEKFWEIFHRQVSFAIAEHIFLMNQERVRGERKRDRQPYLSCFTRTCIERGTDINEGGTVYPMAFGFGFTGLATMADSFAAIEKVVFEEKILTLAQLRDAMQANFEGYEDIRIRLLAAPKYGNNDDYVDKYAKRFVDMGFEEVEKYQTWDGGKYHICYASNVNNIRRGKEVAATADGRKAGIALSDATSPMRNMDKNGLTQAILSVSKPDYTKAIGGTVYNVKLAENTLADKTRRDALREMIRVYFLEGGGEIQINCVSKKTLQEAMEHPDEYQDLIVRVSGFSTFYTTLDRAVQQDILERTEH